MLDGVVYLRVRTAACLEMHSSSIGNWRATNTTIFDERERAAPAGGMVTEIAIHAEDEV